MPELSRFLGIVIAMYYRDHGPAHFHAIYGDFEITVEIESGHINGDFPKRALAHVLEWKASRRIVAGLGASANQPSVAAY
jgi:hypothetical protein